MPKLICPKCGRTERYGPSDFQGKWWKPVWTTSCYGCRNDLQYRVGTQIDETQLEFLIEQDKARRKRCKEADWPGLSEFWIQIYLREHAANFGLEIIEPVRPAGPDFRVWYKNRIIDAEVELRWDDYLRHKHHLSDAFRRVGLLVVLSDDRPIEALRCLLPSEILCLSKVEFLEWHAAAHDQFAREVQELENGQFTSYRLSKLTTEEKDLLNVQGLVRRLQSGNLPDAEKAQNKLVAWLDQRGDCRAKQLMALNLSKKSKLVDRGYLPPTALQEELRIQLRELFPESTRNVDLRQGIGPHYLRRC